MTSAVLAGSTGLVGSNMLTTLLSHPNITTITAYTRRDLPTSSPKLHPLNNPDTTTWPASFPANAQLFLSALGTTRAAAGSLAAQRKIDLDLNYELARAAKDRGVTTYVLISAAGVNAKSWMPYSAMKGELEERVKGLGFEHTVIVRPGLILGGRGESRFGESVAQGVAGVVGRVRRGWVEGWAQEADVIGRAAVRAGVECVEGRREGRGVWEVDAAEIWRLGREP